ncbi:MAG: hypothetical protein JW778_07240 [Candidatus Altiarchaeota archaeon]|nr:hypothetical protein [Candidatus Altiarchaeota archaeon]
MTTLEEICGPIEGDFDKATETGDQISYNRLAMTFNETENKLREYIQEMTKEKTTEVIQKLREGEDLSREELEFVRLWTIGDAEYYIKVENNFNDWLRELKRIVDEILKIKATADLETTSHLRAMLEDGKRVIYDIVFYLEKKERVTRFNEATKEIDAKERKTIISLLKTQLESKEV